MVAVERVETFLAHIGQYQRHIGGLAVDDLRTLLALARSNSWQDIETAPKDKGAILGFMWVGDGPVTRVLHWDEEDGWHSDAHDYQPTHWQPLPSPPPTA